MLLLQTTPDFEIESQTLKRSVKETVDGGLRGSSSKTKDEDVISPTTKAITSIENTETVANKGRDTMKFYKMYWNGQEHKPVLMLMKRSN